MHRYNTRRKELLLRRGRFPINHPDSVATTWSLSFHQVKQEKRSRHRAALPACVSRSRVYPRRYSVIAGAAELGPILSKATSDPLELDYIIELLLNYSLIRRNPSSMSLSIHRLIQVVLKDNMDWETQSLWAERAIRAVNRTFPDVELRTWDRRQQCLPHVEACMLYIHEYKLAFPEAARLFTEAASYLIVHGRYDTAELLLLIALKLRQNIKAFHPDTARTLKDLGVLYLKLGKYQEAEVIAARSIDD